MNALKLAGLLLMAAAFISVLWVVSGPATGIAMTVFFIVGTGVSVALVLRRRSGERNEQGQDEVP